jgi:hypothetical protein
LPKTCLHGGLQGRLDFVQEEEEANADYWASLKTPAGFSEMIQSTVLELRT